ncbi:CCA tRNA nucleotidyltransferase [Pseudoblastomonas halimionae]|uniref:CCA tRNA nucleotidyltransferase n=1 Tax=Alteriqipengyuania halimionae TaxID=1926630 RepID=A0A6I4U256_9SPHN|nr:CCA tRNA nucleotidyltransferase [Alteriqipengyuania halimionae]MXP09013.1 CCA tRNA nucleotidyltransferase [Alteriqipengyuania halimionae]
MTTLPETEWTGRADLAELVAALGPGKARWVGGAVRDTLLGLDVKDIDCATPLTPQDVIAACRAAGIRTVPTGIDHGTVTALRDSGNVEITTLRRDVSTDGRRATVAFSEDWKEDAARRDFTINALYADPATGEIHDYFGGLADLKARTVRFIGDARERIREDHLRILRYFRFQARFGSHPPDAEAEAACAELAPMLKGISRERIASELLQLLVAPGARDTLQWMERLGVLAVILPEADAAGLAVTKQEAANGLDPDPIRRLAAILPADRDLAGKVAGRLRLSNAQKKRLQLAALRESGDADDPRALAYRVGLETANDRLAILGVGNAPLHDWEPPRLPLKGGAIVKRGVKAGPDVARLMRTVEARWIGEDFPGEERVMAMLDEELAK